MSVINFNTPFTNRTRLTPVFKGQEQRSTSVLFLCDFDGTFYHREKSLPYNNPVSIDGARKLKDGLIKLIQEAKDRGINLLFGYATARNGESIMNPPGIGFEEAGIKMPEPDYCITVNGSEIHKGDPRQEELKYTDWAEANRATGFNGIVIEKAIQEVGKKYKNLEIVPTGDIVQPKGDCQGEFVKSMCVFDRTPEKHEGNNPLPGEIQVKEYLNELRKELKKHNQIEKKNYLITGPYPFKGEDSCMIFEVSSPIAHKGDAVNFLLKDIRREKDIDPENVIIACDGGNDISMCTNKEHPEGDGRKLIIVGDNKKLRETASKLVFNNVMLRPQNEVSSLGVLAGLKAHLNEIHTKIREKQGLTPLKEPAFKNNPFAKAS